ncbi:MAG: glutamate-1-semialdehyde 2,1-aminomutase [Desulfobacterales bacterium]|nr:glutamate-1-semialdehyde 2,1-aminomutase [Desulfobacterales bacterium]
MNRSKSNLFFEKAKNFIPGGVNSPVRACKSVGLNPIFIESGKGSKITDADGNEYIDYVCSWGPIIIGHSHPSVIKAIESAINKGLSFGAPTELEIKLAEILIDAVPSMDMVRMVNSGTEATMSAIRLARGFTGRDIIIKFDGCYHGHADSLLVQAGSGIATLGIPGCPGVPSDFVKHTISLPYNDINAIKSVMNEKGEKIACIIVEPVVGNMGLVKPIDGFLETLRDLTQKKESILIFDEVMTGFRVAYGGAQSIYSINPDITCLGKVIGGGLPVGAYGGKKEIMEHIAPIGSVYQAGTLSGNPVAMAAGIATLNELKSPQFYESLNEKSELLIDGLKKAAYDSGIKVSADKIGGMLGLFFTDKDVTNYDDAKTSNLEIFSKYYRGMLEKGIYMPPSQFEAFFISNAHTNEDIEYTVNAAKNIFNVL